MLKIVLLFVFLNTSCALYKGQQSFTVIEDLTYSEQHKFLKGDIYVPEGKGPFPGIILVHGGGWSSRDREDMRWIAESLVTHGFIVFNIDYRLAPQSRHPAPIEDLETAITFLKKNDQKWKLNQKEIGLWGYSSGGHTVSYYALTRAQKEELKVQAVVSGGGPYDLTWYPESESIKKYIGAYRDKALIKYYLASATTWINKKAPPFYLYHAKRDEEVEFHQMTAFAADLKLWEIPVKTQPVKLWGHISTFLIPKTPIIEGVEFLKDVLK